MLSALLERESRCQTSFDPFSQIVVGGSKVVSVEILVVVHLLGMTIQGPRELLKWGQRTNGNTRGDREKLTNGKITSPYKVRTS